MEDFLIDLFCGAGGTTCAAERVPGLSVVWCINHDANAIKSHSLNHPNCVHSTEDIRTFDITPLKELVDELRTKNKHCRIILHASLECTNFSIAKCGPKDADSRTLAEDLVRYLEVLDVDILTIENVKEFRDWGPLDGNNNPIKDRKGESYKEWVKMLTTEFFSDVYYEDLLVSADFGGYTIRERLFLQFSKDPRDIGEPVKTHTKDEWLPIRDVLDFENHGKSMIFRKKALAANTIRRTLKGLKKFGPKQGTHFGIKYYGQDGWQDINAPSATLTTKDRIYPVFVKMDYGQSIGHSLDVPSATITKVPKSGIIYTELSAFVHNPQYGGSSRSVDTPSATIIARQDKAPIGLTEAFQHNIPGKRIIESKKPDGKHPVRKIGDVVEYHIYDTDHDEMKDLKIYCYLNGILDILMRPLEVKEMLKIQGFPEDYKLIGGKGEQKKWIGNSVEVEVGDGFFSSIKVAINRNRYRSILLHV